MALWRQQGPLWTLAPAPGSGDLGVVEFIGGSYLAATPQLSYRRLLEALAARGRRILAWSYVPGFDHQNQANEAWRAFRTARGVEAGSGLRLRLGHSLGCKLHLLAPDGGRGCNGLVALSFNNFSAERSVPLLAEMGQQFGFRSEFSPSPRQTLQQVNESYRQPRNLLVRFRRDGLDESPPLLEALQARPGDASDLLELPGDHLTPASAGVRRNLLGDWADDPSRQRQIERLAEAVLAWSSSGT
ncbi:DUF1350 family protein [Synechococcus sp. CCY 9618]|uniref:DUF1350 family protein n=1 Tax=Synechococcus sp. CCY 9618 TaxID=2815602 RepID=UPI001C242E43|nr:DUF1350 family protein [Synechococcus sp. CCY 9618]